jgi:prepilin-type processing-associated H-X9-DG protein
LTDPGVLLCPSDPNDTIDTFKDKLGNWNLQAHYVDDNGVAVDQGAPGAHHCGGQQGVQAVDASYVYFGWLFDKCGDEAGWTGLIGTYAPLLSVLSSSVDATQNGPIQFLVAVQWMLTQAVGMSGDAGVMRDRDLDCVYNNINYGNGGGKTVYRLREGIERFLITDINNPAATARAQSEIFVWMDVVSIETTNFNHVPGGCNVLYMDGHVTFIRYPEEGPVSKAMAQVTGAIAS